MYNERGVQDPLLEAPELGAAVDVYSLYDAVAGMRPVPLGKRAIVAAALPALVPMIALAALQVPIKTVLLKILTTLA